MGSGYQPQRGLDNALVQALSEDATHLNMAAISSYMLCMRICALNAQGVVTALFALHLQGNVQKKHVNVDVSYLVSTAAFQL